MMHLRIRDHRVAAMRGNLGPRLWQQGAQRQGGLPEQRDQDRDPAAAKDTHQAQAGRPALAALVAQGRGHIEQRARGDRLLGDPADAEQPQGGDRHRQPQPCRAIGLGHAGALPLPARAFDAS